MREQPTIRAIEQRIDAAAALGRVAALAGGAEGAVERKLYYPYFHFRARCAVPTLAGRQALALDCLVDGINGTGATADPFGCDALPVAGAHLLAAAIGRDEAERIARRTVTHRLGRKLRMIAPFAVELEACGVVYRGFWIVGVAGGRVMVDSATGAIQSVGASAA